MYKWANALAAVPHAIARIAALNVDVDVRLPLPLSPHAQFAIPCQSEPLHDMQSAKMSREKEKERGLTALSNSSLARRSAMHFPTRTTKRPATCFNSVMSRRLRATQKSLARCSNSAYVLERITESATPKIKK
jgi:hypothetical protein